MIPIFIDKLREALQEDFVPKPDIAICSACGWKGPVSKCLKETEGDWEYGYYPIDLCPVCEDGGCIDDYEMTLERATEWNKWWENKQKKEKINDSDRVPQ